MNNINDQLIPLLLLIITGLIIYQLFFAEEKTCPSCQTMVPAETNKCPACNCNVDKYPDENKKVTININNEDNLPNVTNPAREYDYRTFNDPLVPPYKRSDYEPSFPPTITPVATRGFPSGFKKMGILIDSDAPNNDKYKFMIIMGRQIYPGANKYDYYVVENAEESSLKFDMKNITKELSDGDTVTLDDLNKTYKIKLDRDLGFRYTPFMF